MKLTKRQLKQIIREEKKRILEWDRGGPGDRGLDRDPPPPTFEREAQYSVHAIKKLMNVTKGSDELIDIHETCKYLLQLLQAEGIAGY